MKHNDDSGDLLAAIILTVFTIMTILFLCAAVAHSQERTSYVQTFDVIRETSYDSGGIEFYLLRSSKGSVLISADRKLPVAQELNRLTDRKITLTIEETPTGEIRFGGRIKR